MEPVAISWLVASATSPLIAVLALWTVYVFHTYRKRWRSVDLFLLAVAAQELVAAVFTFGFAIVSLINPPLPALCSFIQWGMVSIRTFQISTLTSMVVDRALTVRWPYRYRFSVRRNQIRYHIAVLALMAALIGAGAVFAHHRRGPACSGDPGEWDFKYVVFSLGFHGLLLLVALVCAIQIEAHKCRNGGAHEDKARPFQLPDSPGADLPVPTSVTSPLDNDSHTGSTKALHRPYRHSSRRPYNKKGNANHSDFRWPPVAVVSLVCFSVNHLPYLVLTGLATVMPWVWSPWHEALLSWLRLAEGVLVPLVLCLVDQPLRSALKRTFQRRSGALSPLVGDDGLFQMYFDKDHFRKRGTFGSVTPVGIITNYRRTPGKKRRARKTKYRLPGLHSGDSVIEKSCLAGSFLSTEPLSKLSCADLTSLEVWQEEEEENFYATLSDDFSNFSANSTDDNALNDEAQMCEDLYGGSFTTIANDDFEFHDTRPCGGEVRMRPAMTEPVQPVNSFRSSTRSGASTKDKFKKEEISKRSSTEKISDLMNVALPPEEDKKDPDLFQGSESLLDVEPDVVKRGDDETRSPGSLSKATSFSMNDLDLIDNEDIGEKEAVFVLPIKSESTMSLYRLHLDKNIESFLTATKSESHINGDSGFGSATQTMNPIWPGYPARKVSDPLSNLRKPILTPAAAANKHYHCILHPRMQKIPWISAWKKLGSVGEPPEPRRIRKAKEEETTNDNDAVLHTLLLDDNFELRQNEAIHWKDSIIYARDHDSASKRHHPELSDVNRNSEECLYGVQLDKQYRDEISTGVNRRESFKALPKTPNEGLYGRINEPKTTEALVGSGEISTSSEENIYEEIVSTKVPSAIRRSDSAKKDLKISDKSYAQTDILKLVNINPVPYESEKRRPDLPKTSEFKLNININPSLVSVDTNEFNVRTGLPVLPEDTVVNISNLVVNCSPLDLPEESVKKLGKSKPEFNHNSRVHVAYNVNDSALEFIDKLEPSLYMQEPCKFGSRLVQEDFNANSPQMRFEENFNKNFEFQQYGCGGFFQDERREDCKPRYREANVKRRDSRNGRSDSMKASSEAKNLNKHDDAAVVRRDSNPQKSRDIKRRESGSRAKRESNIPRKESDHRHKKPRCSTNPEASSQKRIEGASVNRNDSFPGSRIPECVNRSRGSKAKTCIQIDDSSRRNYLESSGYGELDRSKRGLHPNQEGDFHPPEGVIRLHCNYQENDPGHNANRVAPPTGFDVPKEDSRAHGRNFNVGDDRRDYVELYRNNSGRDAKLDRPKRHDLERKESDSRVRRKTSGSRADRRESLKEGRKRARRTDSSSKSGGHVRRTNSFQETVDADELNRNESVKLNSDALLRDEHARMDNLVYGRSRDNGNYVHETEVLPFDTYVKPPSYSNLMKYHSPDPNFNRERGRQKKIAITDYL